MIFPLQDCHTQIPRACPACPFWNSKPTLPKKFGAVQQQVRFEQGVEDCLKDNLKLLVGEFLQGHLDPCLYNLQMLFLKHCCQNSKKLQRYDTFKDDFMFVLAGNQDHVKYCNEAVASGTVGKVQQLLTSLGQLREECSKLKAEVMGHHNQLSSLQQLTCSQFQTLAGSQLKITTLEGQLNKKQADICTLQVENGE